MEDGCFRQGCDGVTEANVFVRVTHPNLHRDGGHEVWELKASFTKKRR